MIEVLPLVSASGSDAAAAHPFHVGILVASAREVEPGISVCLSLCGQKAGHSLGPALDIVHLSDELVPVVLVDHGRLESLLVIRSSSAYQRGPAGCPTANDDLLVVHDSVNVRDDALIRCRLDSAQELFFRSPVVSDGSFLVKLSQVPDVVAAMSARRHV